MNALKEYPPVIVAKTFSQMLEMVAANSDKIPSLLVQMFHNASPEAQKVILDDIRKRLERENNPVLHLLHDSKIACELAQELKSPAFTRLMIKLAKVSDASKLMKMGLDIQLTLGLNSPPLIQPYKGTIAIDVPNANRGIAKFKDYWKKGALLDFAAGVNVENQLVMGNFGKPTTCHMLGAGTSGSGKSVFLQGLLISLLQGRSGEEIKVIICDCKRVTFPMFRGLPHLLTEIIAEPDNFIEWLENMVNEMESRYKKFEANEVQNIGEYVAKTGKPMIPFVLVCDEYADLMAAADKDQQQKMESMIVRLCQKARAAGIHVVLFTQKATDVISTRIRLNCPAWVLLYLKDQGNFAESQAITGSKEYDASKLLGYGDMYFMGERVQALLPDDDDFHSLWSV